MISSLFQGVIGEKVRNNKGRGKMQRLKHTGLDSF